MDGHAGRCGQRLAKHQHQKSCATLFLFVPSLSTNNNNYSFTVRLPGDETHSTAEQHQYDRSLEPDR